MENPFSLQHFRISDFLLFDSSIGKQSRLTATIPILTWGILFILAAPDSGLYEKDTHVTVILAFYLMLRFIPPKLGDTIEKKSIMSPNLGSNLFHPSL